MQCCYALSCALDSGYRRYIYDITLHNEDNIVGLSNLSDLEYHVIENMLYSLRCEVYIDLKAGVDANKYNGIGNRFCVNSAYDRLVKATEEYIEYEDMFEDDIDIIEMRNLLNFVSRIEPLRLRHVVCHAICNSHLIDIGNPYRVKEGKKLYNYKDSVPDSEDKYNMWRTAIRLISNVESLIYENIIKSRHELLGGLLRTPNAELAMLKTINMSAALKYYISPNSGYEISSVLDYVTNMLISSSFNLFFPANESTKTSPLGVVANYIMSYLKSIGDNSMKKSAEFLENADGRYSVFNTDTAEDSSLEDDEEDDINELLDLILTANKAMYRKEEVGEDVLIPKMNNKKVAAKCKDTFGNVELYDRKIKYVNNIVYMYRASKLAGSSEFKVNIWKGFCEYFGTKASDCVESVSMLNPGTVSYWINTVDYIIRYVQVLCLAEMEFQHNTHIKSDKFRPGVGRVYELYQGIVALSKLEREYNKLGLDFREFDATCLEDSRAMYSYKNVQQFIKINRSVSELRDKKLRDDLYDDGINCGYMVKPYINLKENKEVISTDLIEYIMTSENISKTSLFGNKVRLNKVVSFGYYSEAFTEVILDFVTAFVTANLTESLLITVSKLIDGKDFISNKDLVNIVKSNEFEKVKVGVVDVGLLDCLNTIYKLTYKKSKVVSEVYNNLEMKKLITNTFNPVHDWIVRDGITHIVNPVETIMKLVDNIGNNSIVGFSDNCNVVASKLFEFLNNGIISESESTDNMLMFLDKMFEEKSLYSCRGDLYKNTKFFTGLKLLPLFILASYSCDRNATSLYVNGEYKYVEKEELLRLSVRVADTSRNKIGLLKFSRMIVEEDNIPTILTNLAKLDIRNNLSVKEEGASVAQVVLAKQRTKKYEKTIAGIYSKLHEINSQAAKVEYISVRADDLADVFAKARKIEARIWSAVEISIAEYPIRLDENKSIIETAKRLGYVIESSEDEFLRNTDTEMPYFDINNKKVLITKNGVVILLDDLNLSEKNSPSVIPLSKRYFER